MPSSLGSSSTAAAPLASHHGWASTPFPGWTTVPPPLGLPPPPPQPPSHHPSSLPSYPPLGPGPPLDYGKLDPALPQSSARGKERLRYITDPAVWQQAELQAAASQFSAREGLKGLAALTAAAPLSLAKAQATWPEVNRPLPSPPSPSPALREEAASHETPFSDDETSSTISGSDTSQGKRLPRLTKQQADILQTKYFQWKGTLRNVSEREVAELGQAFALKPSQIEKRFKYLRKKLRSLSMKKRMKKHEGGGGPGSVVHERSLSPSKAKRDGRTGSTEKAPIGSGSDGVRASASGSSAGRPLEDCLTGTASNEDGDEATEERDEDKKRRWMTKEQAKACQQKFEEWGGSLRGRQEEVMAFSKSIGLSALQVEKRFHYIRKHYEKVSKRLTVDDDVAKRAYDMFSSASPVFNMCPASTQVALLHKMNVYAQHELDCDRIIRRLISLAANCRYHSDQVMVRASPTHTGRLEESSFFKNTKNVMLEGGKDWLSEVDLAWLTRRSNNPEPFAAFKIEGGPENGVPALLTKCADMRLHGHTIPFFIVVARGRQQQIRSSLQSAWAHVLIDSVPGLNSTRIICEENIDYLVSDSSCVSQLSSSALELLFTISTPIYP